jgi:ATP-binding cassette subfamily B protein
MIVTLVMDSYLSLVMFGVLPAIFLVTLFVSRIGVRLYTGVQKAVDNMIRVVREDSQGIRVIKALSKVKKEHQRYDQVNQKLVRAERKAGLVMGSANPIMDLLMNLGIIFVVLLGAYRVMGRQTQPGKIVAFTQYFTMISTALISVTRMFMMYTKFSASAIRIKEVVDAPMGLTPLSEKKYPPINEEGYLVLDDVSFAYPNSKETLQHISFSLPRRSSLGIIGATGSGKTTLINLIMRLYDVDSGAVRIKGRDIRTIPEEELHHIFGIAMQNDFLYSDTIEENISFGRDLPHESVVRAAKIAQADDFIMSFSKGYTYVLNQKATNLSGGQKQRILIARALAADPDILILDDSSSALDYKTDAALRQAIARHHNDATQIIVAQRVSSVKSCDQILVLEEGKILGLGDHEHLMKTCEVYREISESQMGGNFVE